MENFESNNILYKPLKYSSTIKETDTSKLVSSADDTIHDIQSKNQFNNNNANNNHKFNQNNKKPKKKAIKNELYDLKPTLTKKYNLRFIEPYEFKYQLYSKGRWIGKKLIDVLLNEFKNYNEEYFLKALAIGTLLVNGHKVEPKYIIHQQDFITHVTTRKENPIIDQKLNIVFEDDKYLVVDKPSSWPVHVCGGYQFNTLHRILLDEYGYSNIKVLHRLDKHTSGIIIFAKTKEAADGFRVCLHSDKVQKNYLCRVKGDFNPTINNKNIKISEEGYINVVRYIVFLNKVKGIFTDCDFYTTDTDVEKNYTENQKKKDQKNKNNKKYDKAGCKINPDDSSDEEEGKN